MKFRSMVLALAVGTLALNAQAANRPKGYKTICSENKTCTVKGPIWVAFGRSDKFFSKIMNGTFVCNAATFGGRVGGGTNECSVPIDGVTPPPAPPPLPPVPPPHPPLPADGSITGATCISTGAVDVNATIVVSGASTVYDGGCKTFNPGFALGDSSQAEGQLPAFRVENGATLRNAILGVNGVDGVHFYGGGKLQNFRWINVGEDAFTVKESGDVSVSGVTAVNAADKWAQINAPTTLTITNCVVDDAGKFLRQNGGTTFKMTVNADRCQISNMGEGVFRSDSSTSVAKLTNSRLRNTNVLCIGNWASCTGSGNVNF